MKSGNIDLQVFGKENIPEEDGFLMYANHQGLFDISYMTSIPNMTVMAPKNKWELSDMLKFAVNLEAPIAIRYPRGEAYDGFKEYRTPIRLGKSETLYDEDEIALVAFGSMVQTAEQVREQLLEQGCDITLVNARFAMPFDKERIKELAQTHKLLVTMEENVKSGGFGEHVAAYLKQEDIATRMLMISIPDAYVEHGNVEKLKQELRIDASSVTERILETIVAEE